MALESNAVVPPASSSRKYGPAPSFNTALAYAVDVCAAVGVAVATSGVAVFDGVAVVASACPWWRWACGVRVATAQEARRPGVMIAHLRGGQDRVVEGDLVHDADEVAEAAAALQPDLPMIGVDGCSGNRQRGLLHAVDVQPHHRRVARRIEGHHDVVGAVGHDRGGTRRRCTASRRRRTSRRTCSPLASRR